MRYFSIIYTIIIIDSPSNLQFLHLLSLVLSDLLHDQLGKVIFSHVCAQMGEVLISVTHEIGQDCVVDGVGLSSTDHRVLVLELQFR